MQFMLSMLNVISVFYSITVLTYVLVLHYILHRVLVYVRVYCMLQCNDCLAPPARQELLKQTQLKQLKILQPSF